MLRTGAGGEVTTDIVTLTGSVSVGSASQPVHVQILTQLLTSTSQHRLVFDGRRRHFVVDVNHFQYFILYTE